MTISEQQSRRQARKLYDKTFGKLPVGWHVHHLDGNPLNNDIWNLLGCSPEKHHAIHLQQGDTVAKGGKFIQFANNRKGVEGLRGDKHQFFGTNRSNETKKRISSSLPKAEEHHKFIGTYSTPCGIYKTTREAAKANNCAQGSVYYRCKNLNFIEWKVLR